MLEVVLALALFVAASTVITSALSASVDETERLRLNAHASNLAATILSEMQMGLQAVESSGPNAFDPPFAEWTWQAAVEPATGTDATGGMRHPSEGGSHCPPPEPADRLPADPIPASGRGTRAGKRADGFTAGSLDQPANRRPRLLIAPSRCHRIC